MFVFVWMISASTGCSFNMLHYVAFKGSYISYDFLSLFLTRLQRDRHRHIFIWCLSDHLHIVYFVPQAPPPHYFFIQTVLIHSIPCSAVFCFLAVL